MHNFLQYPHGESTRTASWVKNGTCTQCRNNFSLQLWIVGKRDFAVKGCQHMEFFIQGFVIQSAPIRDCIFQVSNQAFIHHVVYNLPWCVKGTGLLSRSEEHTSELQSRGHLVCSLLL